MWQGTYYATIWVAGWVVFFFFFLNKKKEAWFQSSLDYLSSIFNKVVNYNRSIKSFVSQVLVFLMKTFKIQIPPIYVHTHCKDLALALVCVKFHIYFSIRTYFFYFTRSLLQNIHIKLSIIHPLLLFYLFIFCSHLFVFFILSLSLKLLSYHKH